MKILTTILTTLVLIFFAGTSFSGESSALMKALSSPQMEMYAGADGAWVIFAQPLDGASTVRNVEALDTLYILTNQEIDSQPMTLTFEMDKTNSELPLLGYRLDANQLIGVEKFDPTMLPAIDFQLGWKLVKGLMSEEWSIHKNHVTLASVGVFQPVIPQPETLVSFQVKRDDDTSELCWQYVYNPVTKEAWKTPYIPPCWFDMDHEGDFCDFYGPSTECSGVVEP